MYIFKGVLKNLDQKPSLKQTAFEFNKKECEEKAAVEMDSDSEKWLEHTKFNFFIPFSQHLF